MNPEIPVKKIRVLVLCTGNSCRSQMAEGLLSSFGEDIEVYSAGTNPAASVHPLAIQVMREIGIDISAHFPKNVNIFLNEFFDYVITVCDHARESCPVFTGSVKNRRHIGFPDPAETIGSEEKIMSAFRHVRDEIMAGFQKFYHDIILKEKA